MMPEADGSLFSFRQVYIHLPTNTMDDARKRRCTQHRDTGESILLDRNYDELL